MTRGSESETSRHRPGNVFVGRVATDVSDRARKAVLSRIRESIDRIGKEHPALGRHLENAIRTGIFCSYQPDRSPGWNR